MAITGGVWIKGLMNEFDAAVVTRGEIEARFGEPGAYVPLPDGSISPERMEAFLAVREDLADVRQAITEAFGRFPMTEEEERRFEEEPFLQKLAKVLSFSKGALGLGHHFGSFFRIRNQSMLNHEMGMGEYTYIYVLAYYSWLGHSLEDGPGDDRDGAGGAKGNSFDMQTPKITTRIHASMLEMLKNQRDTLDCDLDCTQDAVLEAEIIAMQEDIRRVPWEDSLPGPILQSLEPYRERLAASWSAATNQFDLAMNRQSGPGSYTAE